MLAFVPFAVVVITRKFLPSTIPMHYNGAGEINRYGSKNELLILASCLSLSVIAVTIAIIVIKHNKNYKIVFMLSSIVISIAFIMQILFSVKAMNEVGIESLSRFDTMQIMLISINALMIFFRIALPFTNQNLIFGLRTSMTLKSKENWAKTHKLSGATVVIGCVAGALFAAFVDGYFALLSFLFVVVVGIAIPLIYSVNMAKDSN